MPKRKRSTTETPATPKKTATPKNPRPTEPSAVSVNDTYDQMPDTIEDPASVFKMGMLEMKRIAINNKLAVVVQEHERRVAAAVAEQKRAIQEVKAELHEAERQYIEQKQAIEKQYGIALRAYTYNDETGVLTKNALVVEELKKERALKAQQAPTSSGQPETIH